MTESASGATGEPASPPVCPRHPNEVAYVRCQRCNRPTCPSCQRQAAVGVQCVDCVAESTKQAPRVTSRFGATPRADQRPLVSWTIIGICVLLYIGQRINPAVTSELWFVPIQAGTEPWRMLTAAFIHNPNGFLHIGFNMYALFIVGGYLEPLLGRLRFALLYLISGLGGSVGYLLLAVPPEGWFTPTLGASGAVFGLFGAMLVLNWHLKRQTGGVVALLLINGAIGFIIPNIAWQAHLGGAVTGAAIAGVLALTAARGRGEEAVRRRRWQWPAYALIVLVLLGLAAWRVYAVLGTAGFA
ncbi:rhomboid family intramembrane serine protease [Ornithinimicrobium sp. Arc0846-15]|nr:rhomboid family intramembrane serine protease [Ornithinimicrobium laminariae]